MNENIPLEAVVPYIVKERDRFKEKLETIVPYTKSLEVKIKELTARNLTLEERLKDYEEMKKSIRRIAVLEGEKEMLIKENSALMNDYKQSEWYVGLKEDRKKLREEIKHLKTLISGLFAQMRKDEA